MILLKRILFKILRLAAVAAIVYLCLVAYLLLSERRLSFPRAGQDEASEALLKKDALRCQTEDGKWLAGWMVFSDSRQRTVLYFADGGEDAATFLAHAREIPGFRFVGFNYRGSAGSEGSPKEKFLEGDVRAMIGCSGADDAILLGHGTGAIHAYNALGQGLGSAAILVDPVESFSSAMSSRYRFFFPEFLSRTKSRMNFEKSAPKSKVFVILDDPRKGTATKRLLDGHPNSFTVIDRDGKSLLDVLREVLKHLHRLVASRLFC